MRLTQEDAALLFDLADTDHNGEISAIEMQSLLVQILTRIRVGDNNDAEIDNEDFTAPWDGLRRNFQGFGYSVASAAAATAAEAAGIRQPAEFPSISERVSRVVGPAQPKCTVKAAASGTWSAERHGISLGGAGPRACPTSWRWRWRWRWRRRRRGVDRAQHNPDTRLQRFRALSQSTAPTASHAV